MRFLLAIVTLVAIPIATVTVIFHNAGEESSAAPLHGAIFTTTPDGGIVNENVHYEQKIEVYLDGGPGPNAPQTAAGLPTGDYYFQVTDPSGKVLLSEDPAKCRKVRVEDGVIVALLNSGATYDPNGRAGPSPCHIQDPPDPPDLAGPGDAGPSGRHDTNTDVDHWPPAIVVQLMPFFDTPNPGGVYKAWIIPAGRYDANGGNPDAIPKALKVKGKQVGYQRDPGFGPPRDQVKTDNFKVREYFPPEVTVRKFHDVNGDGVWDDGEPEIGLDQCVMPDGSIEPCGTGGGWPYMWTAPVDGGTLTDGPFYTPNTHVAGIPGTYSACEILLPGWAQTALYADGVRQLPVNLCGEVDVAGISGETHEIIFGNTRPGEVSGRKVIDANADGNISEDVCPLDPDPWGNNAGCQYVEVHLDGDDNLGNPVSAITWTDEYGHYAFIGIMPGSYVVTVVEPPGFYCSYPDPCNYSVSLASGDQVDDLDFGDYSLAEVYGIKFFDRNGNGVQDAGEEGIPDVEIHLDGQDGTGADVHLVTWTCGGMVDCGDNPMGTFWFTDLVPGDYEITEVAPTGFFQIWPDGDLDHDVELMSDEVCEDKDFANFGPCDGLTPGYWSNWDNHYTDEQFLLLLEGTVAEGDIDLANFYLSSIGCDGGDALHCMRRFLLANQLTLNLTRHSELPDPDGAGLVGLCSINGVGTLQSAIDDALAILAHPGDFNRDQILTVKNRLAAFAELNSDGAGPSQSGDALGSDSSLSGAAEPSASDPSPRASTPETTPEVTPEPETTLEPTPEAPTPEVTPEPEATLEPRGH